MEFFKRPTRTAEKQTDTAQAIQKHFKGLGFKPPFDRDSNANTLFTPVRCLNGDRLAYVTHDIVIRNPGNWGNNLQHLEKELRELTKNSKITVAKLEDGAKETRYVIKHPDD